MADRVFVKRQKSLQLQAEHMRTAKAQRSASVEETIETVTEEESVSGPSGMNDSVMLPAPDFKGKYFSEPESDSGDDSVGADFNSGRRKRYLSRPVGETQ